jgi:hypothetical protein
MGGCARHRLVFCNNLFYCRSCGTVWRVPGAERTLPTDSNAHALQTHRRHSGEESLWREQRERFPSAPPLAA